MKLADFDPEQYPAEFVEPEIYRLDDPAPVEEPIYDSPSETRRDPWGGHAEPAPTWGDGSPIEIGTGPVSSGRPAPAPVDPTSSGIDRAVELLVAGLKVKQAYDAAGRPAVQYGGQVSPGRTVTARRDGTIATTDAATGRVTVGKPAPGVPWATQDGAIIVNQGDGTYSVAGAGQAPVTRRYPPTVNVAGGIAGGLANLLGAKPGDIVPPLLIPAIALGAMFLIRNMSRGR